MFEISCVLSLLCIKVADFVDILLNACNSSLRNWIWIYAKFTHTIIILNPCPFKGQYNASTIANMSCNTSNPLPLPSTSRSMLNTTSNSTPPPPQILPSTGQYNAQHHPQHHPQQHAQHPSRMAYGHQATYPPPGGAPQQSNIPGSQPPNRFEYPQNPATQVVCFNYFVIQGFVLIIL